MNMTTKRLLLEFMNFAQFKPKCSTNHGMNADWVFAALNPSRMDFTG